MSFARGGRIDDEPRRWLVRRAGSLWCATEFQVGYEEAIAPTCERLERLVKWAATAGAPWLSELDWEHRGHNFTVFDRGYDLLKASRLPRPFSPEATAWVDSQLLAAMPNRFDGEGGDVNDLREALWFGADGRLWLRPNYVQEDWRDPDEEEDTSTSIEENAATGPDEHVFLREITELFAQSDVRRNLESAQRVLDGNDPEALPDDLVEGLLANRDDPRLWAVALDCMLDRQLPRAELMLHEKNEADVQALLTRFPELGLGELARGTQATWQHGYVLGLELTPMPYSDLSSLLKHPSCRFLKSIHLRTSHFIDAVELVGDLASLGHPAVLEIIGPANALSSEGARLRSAFPRLKKT